MYFFFNPSKIDTRTALAVRLIDAILDRYSDVLENEDLLSACSVITFIVATIHSTRVDYRIETDHHKGQNKDAEQCGANCTRGCSFYAGFVQVFT